MRNPKVVKRKNNTALHLFIVSLILYKFEPKPCVASPDVWSAPLSLFKCVSGDERSGSKNSCDDNEFDSVYGDSCEGDADDDDDFVHDDVSRLVMKKTCTCSVDFFVPISFEEALKVNCEQTIIENQLITSLLQTKKT